MFSIHFRNVSIVDSEPEIVISLRKFSKVSEQVCCFVKFVVKCKVFKSAPKSTFFT